MRKSISPAVAVVAIVILVVIVVAVFLKVFRKPTVNAAAIAQMRGSKMADMMKEKMKNGGGRGFGGGGM